MGAILLNSAGGAAADPILKGLPVSVVVSPDSLDIASFTAANIETVSGFPAAAGSFLGSVSPASTVIEKGTAGTYNDTTKNVSIGATTGLSAGDFIYLSHGAITDGVFEIASVVNGTDLSLVTNPFNGGGNLTLISYQVAWKYEQLAGTAPYTSSAGGVNNFVKTDVSDGAINTQTESNLYIRDPLTGVAYISVGAQSYNGGTVATATPALSILPGWANKGGVTHVGLSGADAFWNAGLTDQTEKTIAAAEAGGLFFTTADGAKSFNVLLRSIAGGASLTVPASMTLNAVGPVITHSLRGY